MADAEDPHRSVKTDSRQRVVYGIAVAIIGGMSGPTKPRNTFSEENIAC